MPISIRIIVSFLAATVVLAAADPARAALSPVSAEAESREAAASRPSSQDANKKRVDSMSWVKLHRQFPNAFLTNGPRDARRIALTFDDAPDPRFTPAILDILAQYDVCATFFVVGARAAKHPAIVKRIHREGHTVGNHSYDHAVLSTLSLTNFGRQIWRTDAVIRPMIGYSPHYIRPPYGELLPQQVIWSKQAGFAIVNWDVDSVDWKNNPSSERIIRNIKKTLQPGSIVLQHAGGGYGQDLSGTIEALPKLIELLRDKGYEPVTLPELLGQPASR
ncbi:polysaccharide deacetylase family protein [Paenibacillus arenilitoris]|uniref:Polysaccharide deacetylase family protein n=1 Tax=Paenibacillus arenilitoris TaxID=2772299 RepID=A0A927CIE8_9BACL|nr:polysaccharide deacetylase family protein [Paenibacillus arenilitoris]MBD2868065.1 polysaccharide deacetylase family protein [Paenibacillus arenilitoris]